MLVVTVYETSQKKVFSLYETIVSRAVPHDFTCQIIRNFARDGQRPHEFRFFLKKIALNLRVLKQATVANLSVGVRWISGLI